MPCTLYLLLLIGKWAREAGGVRRGPWPETGVETAFAFHGFRGAAHFVCVVMVLVAVTFGLIVAVGVTVVVPASPIVPVHLAHTLNRIFKALQASFEDACSTRLSVIMICLVCDISYHR